MSLRKPLAKVLRGTLLAAVFGSGMLACAGASADMVELLSGAKVRGKMVERDDEFITFHSKIGSRTFVRKYPVERIHALVVGDQREVLNQKSAGGGSSSSGSRRTVGPEAGPLRAGGRRSESAVKALIEKQGRAAPEWWDGVQLRYPRTLDLSWPAAPPRGWNNQRNVGQYVWDVINPNPSKWREGVRFMHHLLSVHENNPATRQRVMNELGRMYFSLLQDYARAAFWWQQAGVEKERRFMGNGVRLAECYWRLGNKMMALELARKLPAQFSMIKLFGDMGELRLALQLADANTKGASTDVACLYAGGACRVAGEYKQAMQYYRKLLAIQPSGRWAKRVYRNQQLARSAMEGIRLFEMLDVRRVPDGSYRSSSMGYKGPVQVEVTVRGGRIESVRVTHHTEKQFYSSIEETTRKIVEKQGFKGIDATSGATITSVAIINAAAKALAAQMK